MDDSQEQTEHISDETRQALAEMFRNKDVDDNGWLQEDELVECLYLVGFFPTNEDVEWITKHFDKNGDGKLQIDELLDNIHILNAHSQNRESMMEAFSMLDKNNDGYIRLPEMIKVLTYKNFMPAPEARGLLTECARTFDRDGDGKFNYAEFVEIFLSENFQNQVVNREKVQTDADQ